MKLNEHNAGSDPFRVLEYLKSRPNDFVSEAELGQQVDGESRYLVDENWVQTAASRLVDLQLAETDGSRNYRLKLTRADVRTGSAKKFISPQIKIMLTQNGLKVDPRQYA
jgi:hypothetical protein